MTLVVFKAKCTGQVFKVSVRADTTPAGARIDLVFATGGSWDVTPNPIELTGRHIMRWSLGGEVGDGLRVVVEDVGGAVLADTGERKITSGVAAAGRKTVIVP